MTKEVAGCEEAQAWGGKDATEAVEPSVRQRRPGVEARQPTTESRKAHEAAELASAKVGADNALVVKAVGRMVVGRRGGDA